MLSYLAKIVNSCFMAHVIRYTESCYLTRIIVIHFTSVWVVSKRRNLQIDNIRWVGLFFLLDFILLKLFYKLHTIQQNYHMYVNATKLYNYEYSFQQFINRIINKGFKTYIKIIILHITQFCCWFYNILKLLATFLSMHGISVLQISNRLNSTKLFL